MCSKKAYLTYEHAKFDARDMRHKHDDANTEVYRCRVCQAWHVGNRGIFKERKPARRPPPLWERD